MIAKLPPAVFIDKLGERLAFEQTTERLYDAMLDKLATANLGHGGPTRAELEEIREAKQRSVSIVRDVMLEVGADPTAATPSADILGVASFGWLQVVTDPHTTFTQCLDIALVAELADQGGWELLVELAEELGFRDLVEQFHVALDEEERHVLLVRTWLSHALLGQAAITA